MKSKLPSITLRMARYDMENLKAMAECEGVSARQFIRWAILVHTFERAKVLNINCVYARFLDRKQRLAVRRRYKLLLETSGAKGEDLMLLRRVEDPSAWMPAAAETLVAPSRI